MANKKPLEIAPTDFGEEEQQQSDRRLELVTHGGGAHEKFSHQTGTVNIDDTGLEEYREREQKEGAERAAKMRSIYEKKNQEQQLILSQSFDRTPSQEQWYLRMKKAQEAARFFLIAFIVYFAFRATYEFAMMVAGREGNPTYAFLLVATVAAAIIWLKVVPPRILRIGARLTYSLLLIYFGIRGLIHLIQVFRHPPAAGINFQQFGWDMVTLAMLGLFAMCFMPTFRFFWRHRQAFVEKIDEPTPEFLRDWPMFENLEVGRTVLYVLEASMLTFAFLFMTVILFRVNPFFFLWSILTVPALTFFYVYPALAYIFFRKVFYPHNSSAGLKDIPKQP